MSDERNFIDQSLERSVLIAGRELAPSELAIELAKQSPNERVETLDRLNADLRGSEMSVSQAAKYIEYESALRNMHEVLRKADR